MNSKDKELAFLILMGGKSNRFGIEKSIVEIFGKSLILYQIETLLKFDNSIFLVAHSEEQIHKYRKQISFPKEINFIVDDRDIFSYENIYKPMLGIYSGFKELKTLGFEKAFLFSCDMPLIKPEIIKLLITSSKEYDCIIPKWNNGFLEYFFAIYPVSKGFEKAIQVLTTKNYGLINLVDEHWNINYIPIEKEIQSFDKNLVSFININGPIDIFKVIKLFKNQHDSKTE